MPTARAFLIGLILAFPSYLTAQQEQPLQLPAEADVRIIVDISGSMKENDPENLRQPAVRLLARMIPTGSKAGVWTFGQWVNMLVGHDEVTAAWRASAIERSRDINSVALRTNLGEAIKVASDPYLGGDDLSNTDFILLTDGKVDLSDDDSVNAKARQAIIGPMLDTLVERGATVHTVALSNQADITLLESLASETGGHFSLVSSAEGLNRAFLKALNAAAPQEQIPLNEEGFSVDSGVEEFTALIFWGEDETTATRTLDLIAPDGTRSSKSTATDNMRWSAETGYDLITVTAPQSGQWRIDGKLGDGSRVTVVSDLRMVVSPVPVTFSEEAPIDLKVAFYEDQTRIEDPDFLNVLTVELRLTSSDGRSGTKVLSEGEPPEDGIYSDQISSLPSAGDYEIELVADGKTFSRQFSGVTRFLAPEVPQAEPEQPGPIDTSQVELPAQPAPEELPDPDVLADPTPQPEPEQDAIPMVWVWAAGGAGLLGVAAGFWLWARRRSSNGGDGSSELSAVDEVPGSDDEGEEAEASEIPVIDEAIPESDEEGAAEDIPELEPSEADTAEVDTPEQDDQEEADDDEFGLEDFDLSEFDEDPVGNESKQTDNEVQDENEGLDGPKKGDG